MEPETRRAQFSVPEEGSDFVHQPLIHQRLRFISVNLHIDRPDTPVCVRPLPSRGQSSIVFHVPRRKTTNAASVIAVSAIGMAAKTPGGPKCRPSASVYARGIWKHQ